MKFDKMIAILIFLFIFISLGNTYTIYHTVKKGENLYTIAKKYGKSVQEIKEFNKLKSSTVYPGQKLIVNKKEQ
ncbi:MAG: LysM peptidoglycan-binding domain-containing protein, partial [bacterium]|nr:LysM peptidoglycan-binding domain-containing protein [bacterium]MDW8163438.1 LysM peptidoglycan-binding domain-containing protein [Candidatus Omnitrophota bacterium]